MALCRVGVETGTIPAAMEASSSDMRRSLHQLWRCVVRISCTAGQRDAGFDGNQGSFKVGNANVLGMEPVLLANWQGAQS